MKAVEVLRAWGDMLMDATELESLSGDGLRYQLVRGELQVMSPAGGRHGRIAMSIAIQLGNFVDRFELGIVLAAETGFRVAVDPDTVLAADVAFVTRTRYATIRDESKYIPFAPDLAVEVMSPSDALSQVESKVANWLAAGCRLVVVVDPEQEVAYLYRPDASRQTSARSELVDCSDVVVGWKLDLTKIF